MTQKEKKSGHWPAYQDIHTELLHKQNSQEASEILANSIYSELLH